MRPAHLYKRGRKWFPTHFVNEVPEMLDTPPSRLYYVNKAKAGRTLLVFPAIFIYARVCRYCISFDKWDS